MSDKFRRGRKGTERFFKKHKGDFRDDRRLRNHREPHREPSRYDPDTRY